VRDPRLLDRYPPVPAPLPVEVVDNHTHLDIPAAHRERGTTDRFPDHEDVATLLAAAAEAGVPRAVQIGCDLPAARWTVQAIERHQELVGGVAIHPNEAPILAASGELDDALTEIEHLARHPRVRAVGETGLDWYRTDAGDTAAVTAQRESFRAHVEMAKRLGLAMQIHDRDAHGDVLGILLEQGAPERTVFHCFSGDADMARLCARHGWYLSFAGTLTFKNAAGLREALRAVPVAQVLVETDAPYLAPVPYRGRPNAGHLVPHTARAMAEVLDRDLETVCAALAATSEVVYGPW
jgi:TatD DNase family protein